MSRAPDSRNKLKAATKLLRHDLRSRAREIAKRAKILSLIDSGFENEISSSGLKGAMNLALGISDAEEQENHQIFQEASDRSSRREALGKAPLKRFRRQLKEDFAMLVEEVQLLLQIDPSFQEEIQKLGLSDFLENKT